MKKVLKIVAIVVIGLILLFPQKNLVKDGGSIEYKALLYRVMKVHSLSLSEDPNKMYDEGIIIEILGFKVFDNVK